MPLPRSLANLNQDISEKKWVEARRWAGGRTSKKKYKIRTARSLRAPRGSPQGTTSRRQGTHAPESTCTGPRPDPPPSAGGVSAPGKRETASSRCVRNGRCNRRLCGRRCRRRPGDGRTGGWSGIRWPMGDVGRQCWTSSPPLMWKGWCRLWKRRRRPTSWVPRRNWVPGRSCRCSYPHPLHGIGGQGVGDGPCFLCYFLCDFLCARLIIFLGQAWAESKGEVATCCHRADSGREKRIKCTPP